MAEYSYDLKKVVPLHHLQKTVLAISAMKGPEMSGKDQYYVNTSYIISEDRRNGPGDEGMLRTKGFSIQAGDIPALCEALMEIHRGELDGDHLFPCKECTGREGKMIFHRLQSADSPQRCPRHETQPPGSDAYSIE